MRTESVCATCVTVDFFPSTWPYSAWWKFCSGSFVAKKVGLLLLSALSQGILHLIKKWRPPVPLTSINCELHRLFLAEVAQRLRSPFYHLAATHKREALAQTQKVENTEASIALAPAHSLAGDSTWGDQRLLLQPSFCHIKQGCH